MTDYQTIITILNTLLLAGLAVFTGQITVMDADTMEEEEGGLSFLPAVCGFMALINGVELITKAGY